MKTNSDIKLENQILIFLAVILSTFFSINILNASELELKSDKYILYNMNENKVLLSKDENKETYIASLTKIMTTIVAIENIKNYDEKVKITKDMFKDIAWDVSVAGFKVGETVTYNDLLYGAILPSGADAVNALALSVSKNYDDFVKLMNKKVKDLNLEHTNFSNVTGLYDKNNYSSAYDVAEILKYSLKNAKFKQVFETKKYTFTNGKTVKSTIENYNSKLGTKNLSYITGGKTGFISASGYCLATTATIDDINYLLITLNADKSEKAPHIEDAIKTYTYFSTNYGYKIIVDNNDIVTTLKTKNAKEKTIDIKAGTQIKKYLKNDFDKNKIKYEYTGTDTISYFTKKGTLLGNVSIIYDGKELDNFKLIYSETLTFSLISFIWNNLIIIIVILFILFIVFRIIQLTIKKKRRQRRHQQRKPQN